MILGTGPVGLCCAIVARLQGAEVLVVEPPEWRRTLAAEVGAAVQVDPAVGPIERAVQSSTDGYGAHVVIDATERRGDGLSLHTRRLAGRVLILTLSAKPIRVQPWQLTCQELTSLEARVSRADFGDLISLVSSGEAPVDRVITHHYAMQQAEAEFRAAHARGGTMVKAVVLPCLVT